MDGDVDEHDDHDSDDERDGDGGDNEDSDAPPAVDLNALRAQEAGRNIFVQNLPFQAEKKDVIAAFKDYGRIEKVNLVRDPVSMRAKGTCFVVFADPSSVAKCLAVNNREASEDFRAKVCGRTVWATEVLPQRVVRGT